ncbi:MAG: hypothetical protein WDO18_09100 [Acidobacteriota bacterium]
MIAGLGSPSHGDGGLATEARLNNPRKLVFDATGSLYVTEVDGRIRKVTPSGSILTVSASAAPTPPDAPEDAQGNRYFVDGALHMARVDPKGGVTFIQTTGPISLPTYVTPGPDGLLYVADADQNRVWQLTPVPDPIQQLSLGPLAPGQIATIRGVTAITPAVVFNDLYGTILAHSESEIVVQVPYLIPMGNTEVDVRDDGKSVAHTTTTVVPSAPAFFAAVNQDHTTNSADSPAGAGSIIELYGTGQGTTSLPLVVFLGGYPMEIVYSGGVPAYPGLWQVNIRLPDDSDGPLPMVAIVGTAVSASMNVYVTRTVR